VETVPVDVSRWLLLFDALPEPLSDGR